MIQQNQVPYHHASEDRITQAEPVAPDEERLAFVARESIYLIRDLLLGRPLAVAPFNQLMADFFPDAPREEAAGWVMAYIMQRVPLDELLTFTSGKESTEQ